ncbi:PilZ domain-containing protein [Blastococcus saxobsidens]|uniref:PilZ domain-containing protein n=1 Tax=Blastococcus saxobsidens TaxID=138336 RepID=A0A4Q7Y8C2_9ACTN|nr:PilZ domain-containing protein [Blastococcus saxobsidens]RZU32279.1 PilZ domain-containing protein [Blastococcus saxobsidens]
MIESDFVRPEVSTSADVTLVARGITVAASVEVSDDQVIAVRPHGEGAAWKTSVKPGDSVELYWVAGYEERTLPAKIVGVDDETEDVVWNLAVTGPAERSQRRRSVRARVELPVSMPWSDGRLAGVTVDLSEAGMRALVDGWGLLPDNGIRTDITLDLEDTTVHVRGEIVRQTAQGPRWLLSMKFLDVSESTGDALRRRVFQALRDERAAATG